MLFIFILFVLLLMLNIAALRWGYDSREKLTGEELERRQKHVVRALAVSYPVEPDTQVNTHIMVRNAPHQQLAMQCHS